jgi:membrane-associated phospholipid phosphatase
MSDNDRWIDGLPFYKLACFFLLNCINFLPPVILWSMNNKLDWQRLSLTAAMLLTLSLFILAWIFPTFPGDGWALLQFQQLQSGWLTRGALVVTTLGGGPVAAGVVGIVTVGMLLLHRYLDALIMALSLVLMPVGQALKIAVGRPRPDFLLLSDVPTSMSFPSGHALSATILGGVLIFLVGETVRPKVICRGLQVMLTLFILAVGASRVYLGLHWPSDVIGGFAFGGLGLVGLFFLRGLIASHK